MQVSVTYVKNFISPTQVFRYFQICQFIRSNTTDFPNEPDPSALEDILDVSSSLKGLISRIYNIITSHGDNILEKIIASGMMNWERQYQMVHGRRLCVGSMGLGPVPG